MSQRTEEMRNALLEECVYRIERMTAGDVRAAFEGIQEEPESEIKLACTQHNNGSDDDGMTAMWDR